MQANKPKSGSREEQPSGVRPEKRAATGYRGRLAPSPTGYLHLGHARTFAVAAQRAREAGGQLFLRIDDLDRERCHPEFAQAAIEDLRWLGLHWQEPIITQSKRLPLYRRALGQLRAAGLAYPCTRTRREIREHPDTRTAPDGEPVFPPSLRPGASKFPPPEEMTKACNWRFRVADGEALSFTDVALGEQRATVGRELGDFLIWRKDGLPSYQLACVVDDIALGISEVVRGADLLPSTARQLLLFRALGARPPHYYHAALVCDASGQRLAKRHHSLALRELCARGVSPAEILRRGADLQSPDLLPPRPAA